MINSVGIGCLQATQCRYSMILFLEDGQILKQVKETEPEEQLQVVMDVLGAEVAASIGASINQAQLIGPHEMQEFKPEPYFPAVRLNTAPGVSCNQLPLWSNLNVAQKRKDNTPCGLLPESVPQLSRHRALPAVAAVDTYTGNTDRWPNNLFYDEASGALTGIDMGGAYKVDLCELTLGNLHSVEITPELEAYRNTLSALIEHWPEVRLLNRLNELFTQAGLEQTRAVTRKLDQYRTVIRSSCRNAKLLVDALK